MSISTHLQHTSIFLSLISVDTTMIMRDFTIIYTLQCQCKGLLWCGSILVLYLTLPLQAHGHNNKLCLQQKSIDFLLFCVTHMLLAVAEVLELSEH